MDAEYKDVNESAPIPSLTLEPELENTPKLVVAEETKLQQTKVAEPVLTPQEQQMVNDFAQKIDVENTAQILQYGAGTQKKMADFSDAALANVRTQDLGEVGDLIVNVVGELKGFDAEEEKGFLGFFRKQANKLEVMKSRYAKAEVNVEKIGDALQQHQVRLLKDSAMLDKMYEQNLAYFKELTMYILAGKKKLQEVREGKLKELEATAQATGLAEDAQAAKDLADKCNRFEKKIYDLELTRTISIQTAPADPHDPEQRQCDGGEDSDHADEHHPPVEESDGSGAGHCPFQRGRAGAASGQRHHQRPAETELREAAHGVRGDREGSRAGHCGHRNPEKDQRRADSDAGRRDEDSVRGPGEAHCRRSGNGEDGERPQGQAAGDPRRGITLENAVPEIFGTAFLDLTKKATPQNTGSPKATKFPQQPKPHRRLSSCQMELQSELLVLQLKKNILPTSCFSICLAKTKGL